MLPCNGSCCSLSPESCCACSQKLLLGMLPLAIPPPASHLTPGVDNSTAAAPSGGPIFCSPTGSESAAFRTMGSTGVPVTPNASVVLTSNGSGLRANQAKGTGTPASPIGSSNECPNYSGTPSATMAFSSTPVSSMEKKERKTPSRNSRKSRPFSPPKRTSSLILRRKIVRFKNERDGLVSKINHTLLLHHKKVAVNRSWRSGYLELKIVELERDRDRMMAQSDMVCDRIKTLEESLKDQLEFEAGIQAVVPPVVLHSDQGSATSTTSVHFSVLSSDSGHPHPASSEDEVSPETMARMSAVPVSPMPSRGPAPSRSQVA